MRRLQLRPESGSAGPGRLRRALVLTCTILLGVGAAGGCSGGQTAAHPAASASSAPKYVGTFTLNPKSGPVGTAVTATGHGFPAGQPVDITWQQVTGSWKIDKGVFSGSQYSEKYVTIGSATTDASGNLDATFKVPEGFGHLHNVRVTHAGVDWNQAGFTIPLVASISPASGPVGTPISLTMTGIGFKAYHQNYVVSYDNVMTGWLSAVTTQGTAHATIPATGAVGVHYLTFYETGDRTPYLNLQQSPVPGPIYNLKFTVTDGPAKLPPSPDAQTPAAVDGVRQVATTAGPQVWLDRSAGPPGTPVTLRGSGFPAGQLVAIGWATVRGNNLNGHGEAVDPLATAVADGPGGGFELGFKAPSDIFGEHKINVQFGGQVVSTTYSITPKALPLQPVSGPVGTSITIHVIGTGSTFTSNIYTVDYDNAYIGFACGFNSAGDITINLPAAGTPGWHYIDLYPSIWKTTEISPGAADYIQMPQLTYADDHPVEKLPAFHYAFNITGSGQ